MIRPIHLPDLKPERARIFRITHIRNLPWILEHGLYCRSSTTLDPNFVQIGHPELISKRATWPVPIAPRGTLGDYVPFYFTPSSIMLLNILGGRNGLRSYPKSEIVILVSSLPKLIEAEHPFIFTDAHAVQAMTRFYDSTDRLDRIDWPLLQARDFARDPNDLGKSYRYQAEALVHKSVPAGLLLGIACYSENEERAIGNLGGVRRLGLKVVAKPKWYF